MIFYNSLTLQLITGLVILTIFLIIINYEFGISLKEIAIMFETLILEMVIVVGIFGNARDRMYHRKESIERYQDEIETYLPWKEPEATYRIVGLIRSLNKLRETNINLSRAKLSGADLSGADLGRADLTLADLSRANLTLADLSRAKLSGADLSGADLSRTDLTFADLSRANLSGADLSGVNLTWAKLSGADLSGADLSGVVVRTVVWITELKQLQCVGFEEIEERYEVIAETKDNETIYRIREKPTNDLKTG